MNGISQERTIRRRRLIAGMLAAAAGGVTGLLLRERRVAAERPASTDPAHATTVLLAFIATLFGHELTAADREDLASRLAALLGAPVIGADCLMLAQYLDHRGWHADGRPFAACAAPRREEIVVRVMGIDYKSMLVRLWSRISPAERAFLRMRWSAVSQLQWMYRHSSVPWRIRGYTRWPGVAGNWRDVLTAGRPYP